MNTVFWRILLFPTIKTEPHKAFIMIFTEEIVQRYCLDQGVGTQL